MSPKPTEAATKDEPRLSVQFVADAVRRLAEPVVAAQRCDIVGLDWRREPQGWVLRAYVERIGHDPRLPGGVTLAECSTISRDLGTALDVAELIDHAYHLEVSSPGLDRPVNTLDEFRRFAGLRAKVTLAVGLPPRPLQRVYRGEIEAVSGDLVSLLDDDVGAVSLPYSSIARAHLTYDDKPKPKPGKGKRSKNERGAKRPAGPDDKGGGEPHHG